MKSFKHHIHSPKRIKLKFETVAAKFTRRNFVFLSILCTLFFVKIRHQLSVNFNFDISTDGVETDRNLTGQKNLTNHSESRRKSFIFKPSWGKNAKLRSVKDVSNWKWTDRPLDFIPQPPFVYSNSTSCAQGRVKSESVIVMVLSRPENSLIRQTIRQTWANTSLYSNLTENNSKKLFISHF